MKFKYKTSAVSVFLIGMMFFSTFAYTIIQSFYYKGGQIKLPDSNIVGYSLESDVRNAYLQNGATIITLEYNQDCSNCLNLKSGLESLAKDYESQVLLEEIIKEDLNASRTIISSVFGENTLVDANSTGITSSLCTLMVYPPAQCAISNLSK